MHPVKSRLVPFRRPRRGWRPGQDGDRFPPPGRFDVLGFTHYGGLARTGSWVLKRKTAKDRLRRTLTAINRWCGVHRHASVAEQHRMLVSKLRGHCAYAGNASSLSTCRSSTSGSPVGRRRDRCEAYPLPRIGHPLGRARVAKPSVDRMRKNPHVRICGGLGSATTLVYPTRSPRCGPAQREQ